MALPAVPWKPVAPRRGHRQRPKAWMVRLGGWSTHLRWQGSVTEALVHSIWKNSNNCPSGSGHPIRPEWRGTRNPLSLPGSATHHQEKGWRWSTVKMGAECLGRVGCGPTLCHTSRPTAGRHRTAGEDPSRASQGKPRYSRCAPAHWRSGPCLDQGHLPKARLAGESQAGLGLGSCCRCPRRAQ
ncbi:MAG: hypothetical protein RL357_385 [Pseudomonadota bacterium]